MYSHTTHNTKEGIEGLMLMYPDLFELIRVRKEAHNAGKKLDSFVLFGSLVLDMFGDVGKFIPAPKNTLKDLPTVERECVFRELIRSMGFDDANMSVVREPLYLPPPFIVCPGCREYFGFDDCHDVFTETTEYVGLNLSTYVGKTLWEYKHMLNQDPLVHSVIDPNLTIRNARFVNNLHHPYSFEHDDTMNPGGWVGDTEGLPSGYVIQDGDQTHLTKIRYFHSQCFWKHIAEKSYDHFNSILEQVGFEQFELTEAKDKQTKNGNNLCYSVATPDFSFTIWYENESIRISFDEWFQELHDLLSVAHGVVIVTSQEVVAEHSQNAVQLLKDIVTLKNNM